MLDKAWGLEVDSRLSCQCQIGTEDLVVEIPKYSLNHARENTKQAKIKPKVTALFKIDESGAWVKFLRCTKENRMNIQQVIKKHGFGAAFSTSVFGLEKKVSAFIRMDL